MQNKRVLITGGTGFLGTQLAAVLGKSHDVTLAGRSDAQNQAASRTSGFPTVLMDVADLQSVRRATLAIRPDVIVHAAGSKFVGQAEEDPMECLDVNVLGSQNVARAAMEFDCSLVVGISSTRAAPPTHDTYGLSKATTERLFCSLSRKTKTLFTSVRLGNIAWSTGSVLPSWQRMLDESAEIITTGPDSRRFFLGVDEAVDLVALCIAHGEEFEGKVFVPKLKQAQIKDILGKFIEIKGGAWKKGEPRLSERAEEILVGDLELPYCHQITLKGEVQYLLRFNDKAENPPNDRVSTANAEQLSEREIVRLIEQQPKHSAAAVGVQ